MTITATADGGLAIGVETALADGTVHRLALMPGSIVQGAWQDTDLSGMDQAVKDLAAGLWTDATVSPYKASLIAQAAVDRAAAAAYVPPSVSPYQARMALNTAGLLDKAQALINDPNTPQAVKLAWDWVDVWTRASPFIAQFGSALGLTSQQIDALFQSAATY